MNSCPKCYGTGYRYSACPECHDDGNVWCTVCAGAGKTIETCKCGSVSGMQTDQRGSGKTEGYGETQQRQPGLMS